MMRTTSLSLAVACAIALSGCVSMAPQYARPDAPVPGVVGDTGSVIHGDSADGRTTAAAGLDWRQVLVDARLQQVIGLALAVHAPDMPVMPGTTRTGTVPASRLCRCMNEP